MATGAGTWQPLARAAGRARSWVEPLARFGMAAKGAVYLIIGVAAARAAAGKGGKLADREGALLEIARAPLGKWLLLAIAIGLCAYVLWRVAEAIVDPEGWGTSAKGLARRAGSLGIGILYGGLAVSAVRLWAWGERPAGQLRKTRELTGDVLGLPGGSWVLGAIAAGVVVFGIVEIVRGGSGSFLDVLTRGMSARQAVWAERLGRLGLISRGVVFTIVGGYGIAAAMDSNPRQVQGLAGALHMLARTGGGWLLGVVGVGLAAYGVYMFFEARHRRLGRI